MTQARQLAFPFPQTDFYDASGVLRGQCNAEALAWMDQPLEWPGLRLAIAGPHGSGKTHLLHAFIQRHNGTLMPGEAIRHLVALPHDGVIAVDDADCAPDQEALLHLLNAAAERKLPLLLAATLPPSRWPVTLPDLVSRLRARLPWSLASPKTACCGRCSRGCWQTGSWRSQKPCRTTCSPACLERAQLCGKLPAAWTVSR